MHVDHASAVKKRDHRMFNRHQAEITVMQFRGHSLPVHHLEWQEVPVVQWLSSQDMDTATRVQILDLTDCISHLTLVVLSITE